MHQFLVGCRSCENTDTLFAVLFCQMLTDKEELFIDHQVMAINHFLGFEEGIADLFIQLWMIPVTQKICTAVRNFGFPILGQ